MTDDTATAAQTMSAAIRSAAASLERQGIDPETIAAAALATACAMVHERHGPEGLDARLRAFLDELATHDAAADGASMSARRKGPSRRAIAAARAAQAPGLVSRAALEDGAAPGLPGLDGPPDTPDSGPDPAPADSPIEAEADPFGPDQG